MTDAALETVDLLLESMSSEAGEDGMLHQFNASGDSFQLAGLYVSVFFSRRKLVAAALRVRTEGATYLRDLSVSDIMRLLTDFARSNYPLCSAGVPFGAKVSSYLPTCDEATRHRLAEELRASTIFTAPEHLVLFPLVTVRVTEDFTSPAFFLCAPANLSREFEDPPRDLAPTQFPPLLNSRMRSEEPACWLGFRAANLVSARKRARTVLGAFALTQSHTYRHIFSGRTVWGGHCTWDHRVSFGFSDSLTPPLAEDIVLGTDDHAWLAVLAELIVLETPRARRQLAALQYYYRAWSLGASERFPLLCMALEALFGDPGRATAGVKAGIDETIGPLERKRLDLLLQIRNSVIHGGAPDVYESSKYGKYFRRYGDDPIRDMELVVAECLRQVIFAGTLIEHEEPHQDALEQARAMGRIPAARVREAVLERQEPEGK